MHGWFQKLWKSRVSSSVQNEHEMTKKSACSVSSVSVSPSSASPSCSVSSSSEGTTPSKPLQPKSVLSSQARWSRMFDVLVCHSCVATDTEEASRLVSFLEAPPRTLRCFLRQRDDCPGSAISTELCQAVQDSHTWALLITPNFLQDEWCKYMMHQVLAQGPMSNRIIPVLHNLPRSQYPQELKFYFYIDLSRNPDRGYALLNKTVLKYLEDLVEKNEKTLDCDMDSSRNRALGEASSKTDKLASKDDAADTSISLEVMEKRNERLSDVCCHHHQ